MKPDIKRIESPKDMKDWANWVNEGLSLKDKVEAQDVWGKSTPEALKRIFLDPTNNGSRNLIICSVYNTMSYDTVEELLKWWAYEKANKVIDEEFTRLYKEIDKQASELRGREQAFKDARKSYWKRMQQLSVNKSNAEWKITQLEKRNRELQDRVISLCKEVRDSQEQAYRYNKIKSLLQD